MALKKFQEIKILARKAKKMPTLKRHDRSVSKIVNRGSQLLFSLSGKRMKSRIMYMELKTHPGGHNDRGPARIGRVTFNRTGKTLTYRGKRFQRGGTDACANYHDVDTREGYWISGPKKNGQDRHPCGGGPVEIDEDVREEYWAEIREQPERANEKFA